MPHSIRFHLDEHVHPSIAKGLRRRGIDVTATLEAGLQGALDSTHIAFAIRESRVVVTHDDDFLTLHAQGTHHKGIAYCHQNTRSAGAIIRTLVLIWSILETQDMEDRVEYL